MIPQLLAQHVLEILVLTSVNGGPARSADVYERVDHRVTLHAAIRARRPGERCVLYTNAPKPKTRCRVEPAPNDITVAWSKVEAHKPWYNNVPGGKFDVASITMVERPWVSGKWDVVADVRPIGRQGLPAGGTMRFAATLSLPDGTKHHSNLPTGSWVGGPTRRVDARRVTLRSDDGYLGYMSELGGIPYIFGSAKIGNAAHQAERGVGVDCADLMIYALRRTGHSVPYVSSRTLGPHSRKIVGSVYEKVENVYVDDQRNPIVVGKRGVQPGDWIIWDGHVGAFHSDRGQIGVLDSADYVMHTAWAEVAIQSLSDTGYGDRGFEVRRAHALDR